MIARSLRVTGHLHPKFMVPGGICVASGSFCADCGVAGFDRFLFPSREGAFFFHLESMIRLMQSKWSSQIRYLDIVRAKIARDL